MTGEAPKFDPAKLTAAAEQLAKDLVQLRFTLAAKLAMGWMVRGYLKQAQTVLERVPPERLPEIAAAAAALGSLAEELAARTPPT